MSLESPGTGGTSIRLSLHETNETYPYDSSADPKQIGWRLLAEDSWLRTLG